MIYNYEEYLIESLEYKPNEFEFDGRYAGFGFGSYIYYFKTKKTGTEYRVQFSGIADGKFELQFKTDDKRDYEHKTGNNEIGEILSTVFEITKNFIKNNKPKYIEFSGTKSDNEEENKRFKIYDIFFKKYINRDLLNIIEKIKESPDGLQIYFK